MAKNTQNILLEGLSGSLGDHYFRQVDGKTVVSKKPDMSKRVLSPAQIAHLNRFEAAKQYARAQMADPASKARYRQRAHGHTSAYSIAIKDFMNPPKILSIDIADFHGQAGDPIRIVAVDDFNVAQVSVAILDPTGQTLASGPAQPLPDGENWLYTLANALPPANGLLLRVSATDLPGNTATQEQSLSIASPERIHDEPNLEAT